MLHHLILDCTKILSFFWGYKVVIMIFLLMLHKNMESYRRYPSYYSVCDWSKNLGIRNIARHWIWASHWRFFTDYSCLWRRRNKNKKWIFHFLWVYQECVSPIVSDKKVKLWTNGGSRNWSCSASKCCLTCSAYHLDHKQSGYQNKQLQ